MRQNSVSLGKTTLFWTAFCAATFLFTTVAGDCPMDGGMGGGMGNMNGNDNTGGGNNNTSAIVKTQITLGSSGKVTVGDDLVVYGIGEDEAAVSSNQEAGIHYLVPSQTANTATEGTLIPNSASLFGTRDLAVAKKKIALVRSTGAVSVFDTESETLVDIPVTEIAVTPMQSFDEPGQMRSAEQYVATINNENTVTDGNVIKVIDTSGTTPSIISFPNPDDALSNPEVNFDQLDIDPISMRVAAISDHDVIYVFDINNPNAAPIEIDLGLNTDRGNFNGGSQIQFYDSKILYHQSPDFADLLPGVGDAHAAILDVDTDTITTFTNNPTTVNTPLALGNNAFFYFIWRENADMGDENNSYRSAIGALTDAPNSTLASQSDRYDLRTTNVSTETAGGETVIPQSQCLEQKLIGYGATACVTPDGSHYFLAGWGPIDRNYDYVQMSTGGAFSDFADPEGDTLTGALMGSDIKCSNDTVVFRGLRETPSAGCITDAVWVLSFIVIDRL